MSEFDEFEERLHETLQDHGAQPLASPQAPDRVLRRTRRRQVSTALVSGVTAIAVIGGAILGVQAIGRGRGQQVSSLGGPGSTRTVTLDGYTVTYPYDWALQRATVAIPPVVGPGGPVVPAPPPSETPVGTSGPTGVSGPSGASGVSGTSGVSGASGASGTTGSSGDGKDPSGGTAGGDTAVRGKAILAFAGSYLQLANIDPDHLMDLTCDGTDVGASDAAMQVRPDPAASDATQGLEPAGTCSDGSTTYEGAVVQGPMTFHAVARMGAGVSDADRRAMLDAYDSITYPEAGRGVFMGGTVSSGPLVPGTQADARTTVSTVVAGGTTDSGADWVILVDGENSGMEVEMANAGFGWASASASGQQPSQPDLDATVTTVAGESPPVVVGSVVATAARVEVRPDGGDAVDVPLLPAPAATGIDRSYFLTELPNPSSKQGEVVALDADGAVVAHQDYDLNGNVVEPGPPIACPGAVGGANPDVTCPPIPTACPTIPAGGANGAAKDCLNCPDNAMCAIPDCPSVHTSGNPPELTCIVCRDVTTTNGATETNSACPAPRMCPSPASDASGSGAREACQVGGADPATCEAIPNAVSILCPVTEPATDPSAAPSP